MHTRTDALGCFNHFPPLRKLYHLDRFGGGYWVNERVYFKVWQGINHETAKPPTTLASYRLKLLVISIHPS